MFCLKEVVDCTLYDCSVEASESEIYCYAIDRMRIPAISSKSLTVCVYCWYFAPNCSLIAVEDSRMKYSYNNIINTMLYYM